MNEDVYGLISLMLGVNAEKASTSLYRYRLYTNMLHILLLSSRLLLVPRDYPGASRDRLVSRQGKFDATDLISNAARRRACRPTFFAHCPLPLHDGNQVILQQKNAAYTRICLSGCEAAAFRPNWLSTRYTTWAPLW